MQRLSGPVAPISVLIVYCLKLHSYVTAWNLGKDYSNYLYSSIVLIFCHVGSGSIWQQDFCAIREPCCFTNVRLPANTCTGFILTLQNPNALTQ